MKRVEMIDTRQGTRNQHHIGNGNTLPYTGYPFGTNHFVMQTRLGESRFFHPDDHVNYGVRLTHQPSPWMGDFCQVLYNQVLVDEETYQQLVKSDTYHVYHNIVQTSFRPREACFQPHYLAYQSLRDGLQHQWTVSKWGAKWRTQLTRSNKRGHHLLMISLDAKGQVQLADNGFEIVLETGQMSGSKKGLTHQYTVLDLNQAVGLIKCLHEGVGEEGVKHYIFELEQTDLEMVIDIATSYISWDQARVNLLNEGDFHKASFDQARDMMARTWETYLDRIQVKGSDQKQIETFYHCLYRTATFPQAAYEYQGQECVHFSFYTGQVHPGYYYPNNGYWDTFRTNYPLYSLIVPEMIPRFLEGIANVAREDTYLPKWLSPDERGLMPGTLVDGVIADAVVKDLISPSLAAELLDAMILSANQEGKDKTEGREGVEDYLNLGYLPATYHESVNKTLDFAYSDYCIGQVASKLNRQDLADQYHQRSLSYRNLFDSESGLMKPRDARGEWLKDIAPDRWGQHYTEGSAWQNSLAVYHNLGDLIDLYGGDQAFCSHLETLINQAPTYHVGGYGYEIHEMTEMARLDFGQLALSNQPSFHIPYLYIYAGYPHLSHLLIKQLASHGFSSADDGFLGDEDNGSLSAWYVLSSIGLYPMTPGSGQWTLGICLFDHVTLQLASHNIQIETIPTHKPYLQVVTKRWIDGQIYSRHGIDHKTLSQIHTICQELGAVPSLKPVAIKDRPYSYHWQ